MPHRASTTACVTAATAATSATARARTGAPRCARVRASAMRGGGVARRARRPTRRWPSNSPPCSRWGQSSSEPCLPPATCHLPLTTYHLPLTNHLPLTTYHLLLTTYHLLLTTYHLLQVGAVDLRAMPAFGALGGKCLKSEQGEYEYEVCPFRSASQKKRGGGRSFSLGSQWRWEHLPSHIHSNPNPNSNSEPQP